MPHHTSNLPLLSLLLFCMGCGFSSQTSVESLTIHGQTMGTTYTIKVRGNEIPPVTVIQDKVTATLDDVDRRMSTYKEDSEISRFNRDEKTDWFDVSKETALVVQKALEVSRRTGGAFDPTVGPLVRLWNFGPGRRDTDQKPSDEAVETARQAIGHEKLEVRLDPPSLRKTTPRVELDLSGIAKGYAVDRVAETLETLGIKDYMVEVGGEVRTRGLNDECHPWRIAIEKPDPEGRAIQQVIELKDRSMATSGDYRNYFEKDGVRYSHLIDPTTGRPIRHRLASVSVRTPTCMEADALATGMIVLGPEKAEELARQEGLDVTLLVRTETNFVEKKIIPQEEAR